MTFAQFILYLSAAERATMRAWKRDIIAARAASAGGDELARALAKLPD